MSMLSEFKEFAMKGNIVDLAVAVIMGAAFGPIISTLVENMIMPVIGYAMAGVDFAGLMVSPVKGVDIKYGLFLNAVVKFLITAFAIFLLVKAMNTAKARMERPKAAAAPAAPPPPTPTETYLREIRDALAKR